MFMLKSTHEWHMTQLDNGHKKKLEEYIQDYEQALWEKSADIKLLNAQIANLEKQLKEAKRRDGKGRFIQCK